MCWALKINDLKEKIKEVYTAPTVSYSERALNEPNFLKREILAQAKYWFSPATIVLFALLLALAMMAGMAAGPVGFFAGMILLLCFLKSKTSVMKEILKCDWEIKKAKLKPKSESQVKGIAYTSVMQSDELVFTDFVYPDGKILSGKCRIGDFVEGMEFYTVIIRGTTIIYTWPTHR